MNSRSELFGRLYDSQLSIEERELAEPLSYLPVFEASRFFINEICQTIEKPDMKFENCQLRNL